MSDNDILEQASQLVIAQHYTEALAIYEKYLPLIEKNSDHLCNLGICYIITGNFHAATNYFIRSLHRNPANSIARTNVQVLAEAAVETRAKIDIYKTLCQFPTYFDYGPTRVRIEPSNICNLKCQHCPTGTKYGKIDREIMSMELFEIILAQLKQLRALRECVLYLGGEPLLNKNLSKMSQMIKKETSVSRVMINSNGMLVTPELAEELAQSGIDEIRISIDGRSPEENDYIRQGSNYNKVKENVHLLKRIMTNTKISIANTLIKQSDEDDENPITPDFLKQDFPDFNIETLYAMKWPDFEVDKSKINKLSLHKKQPKQFCALPFTEIAIRANGDLVLCCYDLLSSNITGNIKKDSISDIWKNSEYKKIRNSILNQTVDELPAVCKSCIMFNENAYLSKSVRKRR